MSAFSLTASGRAGWAAAHAEASGSWLEARDYRGWDPYDGLMSPITKLPLLRSQRHVRFAVEQLVKRSPVNLRPLLRIPFGRNPVTLALAAQGHAYLASAVPVRSDEHRERAHRLVAELARARSPGWSGNCWGYDFDWQARRLTIPAGFPTLVATGIVTNSLFEVDRLIDDAAARELVVGALPFLDDLQRTSDPDGAFCWSYTPSDHQVVLNAAMKGARLCVQVAQLTGVPDPLAAARSTVAFVSRRQRPDGSWPYAIGDDRSWSDNFHTGYVLDALAVCAAAGVVTSPPNVLERGFTFYRNSFFAPDGAPLYYPGRPRPIDATACGQSLLTLCNFEDLDQALHVAHWTIHTLGNDDGSFGYQLRRFRLDRTVFTRWSVAWMFCGLARLALALC